MKNKMFNSKSNLQKKFINRTAYQIPILMPDEFWIGYLGRLLTLNGVIHNKGLVYTHNLLNYILSKNNLFFKNHSTFTKIAIISGSTIETLLQRHSLIPFLRSANSKNQKSSSENSVNKYFSFSLIKKGAYFCKSCVDEDISYRGVPYWRKSHQLPGINWCLKHDCCLYVVHIKNAMHTSPDIHLQNEAYTKCVITEEVKQDPIVQKFSDNVQHFADNGFLFNLTNLAQILKKEASDLNLSIKNKDHGKFISDFLIEKLPASWRNDHFPILNRSVAEKFFNEFDNVVKSKNQVKLINILLVISALLHDSTNVFCVLSQYSYTKESPRSVVLNEIISKKIISEERISKAYIKYFGQTKNIAKEINYSDQITAKLLIYFGYYPLAPITQTTIKALIEFKQGVPIEKLLWSKDVNINHIFLITHPGIKGMREILINIKNDASINDTGSFNVVN